MKQIPAGRPGSLKEDGIGSNGSPVLRTRQRLRIWKSPDNGYTSEEDPMFPESSPDSVASSVKMRSSVYEDQLVCLTTSTPDDPDTFALLRRACIQVLSCEVLPRGLTSGCLSLDDPVNGSTVAFKFPLPDRYARGSRRQYALLAVAKPGSSGVMEAASSIWSCFIRLVKCILAETENQSDEGRVPADVKMALDLTNVSSYLTGRAVDPDGFPRHGGIKTKARNLAEITGDEYIFAKIHRTFEDLLSELAERFEGLFVESQT
ncbi:MAG: hypothetical protein Q9200_004049 [Gallowayella weberi]